jgi:hypothetical protein
MKDSVIVRLEQHRRGYSRLTLTEVKYAIDNAWAVSNGGNTASCICSSRRCLFTWSDWPWTPLKVPADPPTFDSYAKAKFGTFAVSLMLDGIWAYSGDRNPGPFTIAILLRDIREWSDVAPGGTSGSTVAISPSYWNEELDDVTGGKETGNELGGDDVETGRSGIEDGCVWLCSEDSIALEKMDRRRVSSWLVGTSDIAAHCVDNVAQRASRASILLRDDSASAWRLAINLGTASRIGQHTMHHSFLGAAYSGAAFSDSFTSKMHVFFDRMQFVHDGCLRSHWVARIQPLPYVKTAHGENSPCASADDKVDKL